ncbi:hypothetical protein BJV82DRAFT_581775 [Fennellomyces sp. T-0311]|nr:hypothetical protein BJV82DRAFT_581775 [Fennellomyces sp. T-0311]
MTDVASAETHLSGDISTQIISTISRLEAQLTQLGQEQAALTETLSEAEAKNAEDEARLVQIKETMSKVSTYYTKLLSLRSTMSMLTARSAQLQRRADKLKNTKLQYLSQIDSIKRTEQARDQSIAARVAAQSPSTSPSVSTASLPLPSQQPQQQTPQARTSPVPSPVHSETVVAVAKKIKKKKPKAREAKIAEGGGSEGWSPKKKS